MCLLEASAQSITDTASGREILSGVASAKGVVTDKTTGMEARMMGEVARATAGVEISEVNVILDKLVALYEKNYARAPAGKTFQECYDVKTVTPTDEYMVLLRDRRSGNVRRRVQTPIKGSASWTAGWDDYSAHRSGNDPLLMCSADSCRSTWSFSVSAF